MSNKIKPLAKSANILIIEDQDIHQKTLEGYLNNEGHNVTLTRNGREALDQLEEKKFDLILLDIVMPEMDGFEFLEALHASDIHTNTPVVVISALDDTNSIVKSVELGAEDYIQKPFNPILLKARIEASLEKKYLRDQEQARLLAEKQQTERDLRKTQTRLQTIITYAPIVLFATDSAGVIEFVVGKGLVTLGVKQNDLLGKSVYQDFAEYTEAIETIRRALNGEAFIHEFKFRDSHWEARLDPFIGDNGTILGVIGVATDITERRKMENERIRLYEDLERTNMRLRDLSNRLVEVQEEERRHLAHELHDEIGQILTSLKISMELGMRPDNQLPNEHLTEAHSLASSVMKMVSELSLKLHPSMLDDLGLLPTLDVHFDKYTQQTNIKVDFEYQNLDQRFPPQVESTAYRVIQESLTNVARYAQVDQVVVRLWANDEELNIQVTDNGMGFNTNKVIEAPISSGIAGMYDRVDLIGGSLSIQSQPGKGATIQACLPLMAKEVN